MNGFETDRLQKIYNGFAPDYDRGRALFDNFAQMEMLAEKIPKKADVLDAGCGSGRPVLRFFADRRCRVTGTDISPAMLKLAARHVPEAELLEADSAELDFPESSFDLITSFYSLFHFEMEKQRRALAGFLRMLRPGGLAYFTLASREYTGEAEFSGTRKFAGMELPYYHVTPDAYRMLLEATGFAVKLMEHLTIGGETMLWILVRKERHEKIQ